MPQWCILSLCAIKSIRYVVYYITYYFYAYFYTKGRQSSEEAVFTVQVWVCIFYRSGGAKEWCILILRSILWSLDICHTYRYPKLWHIILLTMYMAYETTDTCTIINAKRFSLKDSLPTCNNNDNVTKMY